MKLKRPPRNSKTVSRKGLRRKLRSISKRRDRMRKPNLSKKQKANLKEELRVLGERPALRPTQLEGIRFLKENNYNAIIADSMGTGKTAQALCAVAQDAKKLFPCLVICPSSVVWNWRREAYFWIRSSVRVHVVEGMSDTFPSQTPHYTIVSWDLLHHRIEELSKIPFKSIVADEAHYAKNPQSLRTQALMSLDVPHKILMTGTPLINEKAELDTLRMIIGNSEAPMIRRLLEDVAPEIPPKTRVMLPVSPSEDLIQEYEEASKDFGGWLDAYLHKVYGAQSSLIDEKIESAMSQEFLVKMSYLRRIVGRAKIPACADWVYRMNKKGEGVVVFGEHHDVLDLFCEALRKLKIGHVRIDGSTGRVERQLAIDNFQRGSINCFIGSRASIEGITLTRATNLAFLERFYTPASEEQAEDRIRRIGQTKATTIWYMVAKDTIDERIYDIVERKRRIISKHIGVEDIEEKEVFQEYDLWKRRSQLQSIGKKLKDYPSVAAPLPTLPDPKYVRGILFGVDSWSIPQVLKGIRSKGFKMLSMDSKESRVFISTKVPEAFQKGSVRFVEVAQDLTCIVGKPVTSDKARMRNYRQGIKRRKKIRPPSR